MNYPDKIDRFLVASCFFMILQIVLIIKFYILDDFQLAYYFCYHAPLLFAIAFYKKDITLIRSLIVIGFVGQVAWLMDYFSYIIFGKFILGNSKFILTYHGIVYVATLSSHLFSTLLALILVYDRKINKKIMYYAYCYFMFFYILNIIHVIPRSYNVNFVWFFEGFNVLPFHAKLYPLYVIPLAVFPGYYVQVAVKKIFVSTQISEDPSWIQQEGVQK